MKVTEYIYQLLASEEYAFSFEEVLTASDKSKVAVRREISRLIDKGSVVNLRQGFYLVITPLYSSFGRLPLTHYVDKLFSTLDRRYYISFYSALKIYGASHQQSQVDFIMTEPPKLRDIKKRKIDIQFITCSVWPEKNIVKKKATAGFYNIASPALTFADIVRYQVKLGGINRLLPNIEELTEEVSEDDMLELLSWYSHKSTLQRMGFLLDELFGSSKLADLIFDKLETKKTHPTLLYPTVGTNVGQAGNRWKIDLNIKLESDL